MLVGLSVPGGNAKIEPRHHNMSPTNDADPFDLERFVRAQANTYFEALAELRRGRKTSHWMWFVFPQIAGLGLSDMSRRYAIYSLSEARAYLAHPVLGARYRECVDTLQDLVGMTAEAVFGPVDAAKLRSSLTLFTEVMPDDQLLRAALQRWFGGEKDERTIGMLRSQTGASIEGLQ